MNMKLKRLFVKFRQTWDKVYSEKELNKYQNDVIVKDLTIELMRNNIESRLIVLRRIEQEVLKETLEKAVELKKESDNILLKLEMYNQSKTNVL